MLQESKGPSSYDSSEEELAKVALTVDATSWNSADRPSASHIQPNRNYRRRLASEKKNKEVASAKDVSSVPRRFKRARYRSRNKINLPSGSLREREEEEYSDSSEDSVVIGEYDCCSAEALGGMSGGAD